MSAERVSKSSISHVTRPRRWGTMAWPMIIYHMRPGSGPLSHIRSSSVQEPAEPPGFFCQLLSLCCLATKIRPVAEDTPCDGKHQLLADSCSAQDGRVTANSSDCMALPIAKVLNRFINGTADHGDGNIMSLSRTHVTSMQSHGLQHDKAESHISHVT
jgi:hypothetical protein